MKLRWPIEDPQVGFKDLIDEAIEDYASVLARLGYFPTGLPRDWEIETIRAGASGTRADVLTCVVEVLPVAGWAAA